MYEFAKQLDQIGKHFEETHGPRVQKIFGIFFVLFLKPELVFLHNSKF